MRLETEHPAKGLSNSPGRGGGGPDSSTGADGY